MDTCNLQFSGEVLCCVKGSNSTQTLLEFFFSLATHLHEELVFK